MRKEEDIQILMSLGSLLFDGNFDVELSLLGSDKVDKLFDKSIFS